MGRTPTCRRTCLRPRPLSPPIATAARAIQADWELTRRRFRRHVVVLHVRHYELAQSLIDNHGGSKCLKTLDSLQLAIALDLKRSGLIDCFVTADKVLVDMAPLEDLKCIDPEIGV